MRSFLITLFGLATAAYCLGCWCVLEIRNNSVPGGVLQQYHGEYADGGSKKWRWSASASPDPRQPLCDFIKTFGVMVYPVAAGGMLFFGFRMRSRYQFAFSVTVFAVCAVSLARFIMLGVLTASLEI